MSCPTGYLSIGNNKCSKIGAFPQEIIDESSSTIPSSGFDWGQIPEWIKVIGGVTSGIILADKGVGTPAPINNNYYQNGGAGAGAASGGFPWWGWVLIIAFAVIALIAIFANLNKKNGTAAAVPTK